MLQLWRLRSCCFARGAARIHVRGLGWRSLRQLRTKREAATVSAHRAGIASAGATQPAF
jgi:hypothetical protein